MDIETAIVSAIGPLVGGRIRPNSIDEREGYPAIQYQSEREPVTTLIGPAAASRVTLTLTVVAQSFTTARQIAAEIRSTLARQADLAITPESEPGDGYDPELDLDVYTLIYIVWDFGEI